MNISIIIPSYNGEELLKENLPSVIEAISEYKKGKVEVIISDDASSDNTRSFINKYISELKNSNILLKLVENHNKQERGFSKNVNRGVSVSTGDILILLNTDVVPYKGFLNPLLEHFKDVKVFAVGCMDESNEDGVKVLRGRGVGKWNKGFVLHSAGTLDKERTLWVSGGSGAFRKNIWDKLGGLNEMYNPFYWEDIDLSYRAQKEGYITLFEKESRVIHEHSKGSIKTFYKPYNIQKIAYRNQIIFVWVNITDFNLLINHILWLPYHILNAIKSKNKAFLVGLYLAVFKFPSILKYRYHMRKNFIKTDKEILLQFNK